MDTVSLEALTDQLPELATRGLDRLVTYIAPDFDDPLPDDSLVKPLPEND